MKHQADHYTAELKFPKPATGGGGGMRSLSQLLNEKAALDRSLRQQGIKRGPYIGAIKLGSPHHGIRVTTGKCQAEFAALAGISERSLRTWEAGTPESVSQVTHDRIVRALQICGVSYQAAMQPYLRHKDKLRPPVRYRDPMTGSTWSGRGLKPAWLRVALDQRGKQLADFEVRA